jgi:selenocysteine lyase/cysteine desulfurase
MEFSDRIRLHTSLGAGFSCGIGTVQVEGIDSGELADWLWSEKRILVTAIKHEEFEGIRVTPSVYSTAEEVERFVGAVEEGVSALDR